MGSSGAVATDQSEERAGGRSQDHECDLLCAAHGDAVAGLAGPVRALHDGLQSLQPMVATGYLEARF